MDDCCERQVELTAKERVQYELEELKERIVKLSAFLYSEKAIAEDISYEMRNAMRDQLRLYVGLRYMLATSACDLG